MAYPSSLDELTDGVPSDGDAPTTPLNDATYPHDDHHRALATAVEAVEAELGTDPAGASATVKARLDTLDTTVSTPASDTVAGRVELATTAETVTGTDTTRAVTPAGSAGTYATKASGGKETIEAHGNTGATKTFDLANGNVHTAAQSEACTYTLSGFTNAVACSLTIILTSVVGAATWPAAVKWPSGLAPSLSGVTILTFVSVDGGTTIYGAKVGSGFA